MKEVQPGEYTDPKYGPLFTWTHYQDTREALISVVGYYCRPLPIYSCVPFDQRRATKRMSIPTSSRQQFTENYEQYRYWRQSGVLSTVIPVSLHPSTQQSILFTYVITLRFLDFNYIHSPWVVNIVLRVRPLVQSWIYMGSYRRCVIPIFYSI